jgi:NDP-sugar pyrophosphorylase family protein
MGCGQGRQLAPYTTVLPRPLMLIGAIPILEVILLQLENDRSEKVAVAVARLSDNWRIRNIFLKSNVGNGYYLMLEK